ncbi:MAG: flagellar hook-basal body complex protein FliE [Lachnospiraceae bacterium]|nr:flagellar hook-basal body complex protein FliE [Lachnospiraceae bacterium]
MDVSLIRQLTGAVDLHKMTNTKGVESLYGEAADGTMFGSILNSAIDNIKTTNSYLSDAENEEMLFALGESDSTHDLMIALNKAQTALSYTVAIRDKVLEAYKELMQIQI